jgi:hypothetical protein
VNRKQKILTVVALIVFLAIGALHYVAHAPYYWLTRTIPLRGSN